MGKEQSRKNRENLIDMIPYGRQDVSQSDIDAVVEVLRSDFLTQGPMVPRFEEAIASIGNAEHAVAVNSATSALHIACLALGVGPDDLVWTSPITFVASSNCALYCGASVDFVDIDANSYNLSAERLREKLEKAEKLSRLPTVVIPVHLCGQSCDMVAIHALSQKYGFKIIEDASHAIGARYKDEAVGCCRYSDITVFSFHPVKIVTTGEGGAALTNDAVLAEAMRGYRSHGITANNVDFESRPPDEIWNYQQTKLGYNYRMTDIQAALGISQLSRLSEVVEERHRIARRYDEELEVLPLTLPTQASDCYSSYHLYPVQLKLTEIKSTQREIFDSLRAAGILVNLHYIPVYRQPYYEALGFDVGYCPVAEKYYKQTITIPLFPSMTGKQQSFVIETLCNVLI